MISDKYRCVFIHVPKCAGESVEIALSGAPFNVSEFAGHPEKHWGIREIREAYPEQFAQYYKFSVIRNPWDRILSWVGYRDKRWQRSEGSFQDRLTQDLYDKAFVNFMLRHSLCNLLVEDAELVVDKVIAFERLNEGFAEVCETLGIPNTGLPHANPSSRGSCCDSYTTDTRNRVAELFHEDIEYFGFEYPEG